PIGFRTDEADELDCSGIVEIQNKRATSRLRIVIEALNIFNEWRIGFTGRNGWYTVIVQLPEAHILWVYSFQLIESRRVFRSIPVPDILTWVRRIDDQIAIPVVRRVVDVVPVLKNFVF